MVVIDEPLNTSDEEESSDEEDGDDDEEDDEEEDEEDDDDDHPTLSDDVPDALPVVDAPGTLNEVGPPCLHMLPVNPTIIL